jgi:hypothetical protein
MRPLNVREDDGWHYGMQFVCAECHRILVLEKTKKRKPTLNIISTPDQLAELMGESEAA